MTSSQLDLFGPDPQPRLFDEDVPTPAYGDDRLEVRAELLQILAEARAATTLPWTPAKTAFYRQVFPQMASWLPVEEAHQLRLAFTAELARLDAA